MLLVSRSGAGPDLAGVRRAAADAADADRLTELAAGAVALYNCINPPSYPVWPTYWPPVAEAFLVAAERTGAVLVTASCLYGYGPVDEPMVEGMPDAAAGDQGPAPGRDVGRRARRGTTPAGSGRSRCGARTTWVR